MFHGFDISSFVVDTDYLVTATVTSGELQNSDNRLIRKASAKRYYTIAVNSISSTGATYDPALDTNDTGDNVP